MCGIGGIVRFDGQPIDAARAVRMRGILRHRGPDGEGIAELGRCVLVHTRLSVIDLLGGAQPMTSEGQGPRDQGLWPRQNRELAPPGPRPSSLGPSTTSLTLVFNGEIYNHRSLRKQLVSLGYRFASDHSDTEVLLHGYREWGRELPKRLHGMFAFAIWDAGQRSLFVCRDRVGKKPLYLRFASGVGSAVRTDASGSTGGSAGSTVRTADPTEVAFASTVSALVAGLPRGQSPAIDPGALLTFLRLGYTFERSMIAGVEELPAAHWMIIGPDGRTQAQRYWRPPPISKSSTSMGAVRATRQLLEEAVTQRLEADVPLGCFLSGGIDSSIIAAMAHAQIKARGGDRLKTYCVAMPDIEYDESRYARRVAEHLGTRHRQLVAEPREHLFDDLRGLIAAMGEPTADSSILPTHWLCRTARDEVTVALCGDGGDELFGGYDRYRAMWLIARHRAWLRMLPLSLLRSTNPRSSRRRLARLVEAARQRTPSQQYRSMVRLFSDDQIRDLAEPAGLPPGGQPAEWAAGDTGVPLVLDDWPMEDDAAHAAMRWDLTHYLPFDLLRKMDRASMAVALEVRCPMLDTQVMDLAGHLPTSVLMPGGRPKGLLRQVAAELGLPSEIVERPKRGFALPIGKWFRGELREALAQQIVEGDLGSLGINRYAAEQMLDEHNRGAADHTHRLFALLMLSLWAEWMKEQAKASH